MDEKKQEILIEIVSKAIIHFLKTEGGLSLCEIRYVLRTAIWDHLILKTLQQDVDVLGHEPCLLSTHQAGDMCDAVLNRWRHMATKDGLGKEYDDYFGSVSSPMPYLQWLATRNRLILIGSQLTQKLYDTNPEEYCRKLGICSQLECSLGY